MQDNKTRTPSSVQRLQESFADELSSVAIDFLKLGLRILRRREYSDMLRSQVALANLCHGIELLTKAFLARRNLSLVFCNLPHDIRALLASPHDAPGGFRWESFALELKSATYKTIEVGDALSLMYVFRPDLKSELHSHTRLLSNYRNTAVHGLSPPFEQHAIERVAFVALRLVKAFYDSSELTLPQGFMDGENGKFLNHFSQQRLDRVRKALESAKIAARKSPGEKVAISVDGWDHYVAECPVCGSDVVLEGVTENEVEQVDEGEWNEYLIFKADRLECNTCELVLEDSFELDLAGVDSDFVRDDDVGQWHYDMHGPEM